MHTPIRLAFIAVASVAAACGPSAPPEITAFAAAPSSLPYGGGTATLTWDVSEDVKSLRIDPSVGEVTGNTGSVEVTVSTTTTFTLTSTNEKGDSTATTTVTVATTTPVSGRIVGDHGQGIGADVGVLLPGKGRVVTDAEGRFSFTDVTPPYDLAFQKPGTREVYVYKGLTRPDPTLYVDVDGALPYSATVTGTASGSFATGGLNYQAARFEPVGASPVDANLTVAGNGTIAGDVTWEGAPTLQGSLHVLQWQANASYEATGYSGYARVDNVSLTNGNPYAIASVNLTQVNTSSVSGLVTVPSGYSQRPIVVRLAFNRTHLDISADITPVPAFSYLVPSGIGSITVLTSVRDQATNTVRLIRQIAGLAAGASNVNFDFPAAPLQAVPSTGATDVTATTSFQWTPYTGGNVHLVSFTPTTDATAPLYRVVTSGNSTTLPQVGDLDASLAIPADTEYAWKVEAYGPFTSVNEVVTGETFVLRDTRSMVGVLVDGNGGRTFTTAP